MFWVVSPVKIFPPFSDLCLRIYRIVLLNHVSYDSRGCWVGSGFVALTMSAQTKLVMSILASMTDSWNIRICVAKQCGGIESTQTFANTGLFSRFPLMHKVISLQV